jgi:hypothetical protein
MQHCLHLPAEAKAGSLVQAFPAINKTFNAILALFFFLFFSLAPSLAAFGYSGISQFKN